VTPQLIDFYRGRRVFVTGHTGFKGSWLTFWLVEMGAQVTGFSKDVPGEPALFDTLGLRERINHVTGDIRDYASLERALTEADPDLILHLAAQALVRDSYDDPIETYSTNVMGTLNLLQALNRLDSQAPKPRSLVNVTTDKCYENREWCWPYRETDALGGHDPYSSSKACSEILTASMDRSFFRKSGKVNIATARAGNVIGGGDQAKDRIVPDCVRALIEGQPIPVRNPISTRPWQHVLEPLFGYLLLGMLLSGADGEDYRGAWNFGPDPDSELTVEELVKIIIRVWGQGEYFTPSSCREAASVQNTAPATGAPHEAGRLTLDSSKARSYLGWRPLMSASKAVEMTISWYRELALALEKAAPTGAAASMVSVTASQIKEFSRLAAGGLSDDSLKEFRP